MPSHSDFGEFVLNMNPEQEPDLIRQSIEAARVNPVKPGHHWHRFGTTITTSGTSIAIMKMVHVDLNAGVGKITETQNGVETARRTTAIDQIEEPGGPDMIDG